MRHIPLLKNRLSGINRNQVSGSAKSGEGEDRDQLKRYYLALYHKDFRQGFSAHEVSTFCGDFLGIIYLTVDASDREIIQSYKILKKSVVLPKLYGLTWRNINDCLKSIISSHRENWYGAILKDIVGLLDVLRLRHFEGWKLFSEIKIAAKPEPLYYHALERPMRESYGWPSESPILAKITGALYYGKK